jgi:hypothetical protein
MIYSEDTHVNGIENFMIFFKPEMALIFVLFCFAVTLFLVAMAEITNQIRQPVEIVGYADDWAIFSSDRDMETAETNL